MEPFKQEDRPPENPVSSKAGRTCETASDGRRWSGTSQLRRESRGGGPISDPVNGQLHSAKGGGHIGDIEVEVEVVEIH